MESHCANFTVERKGVQTMIIVALPSETTLKFPGFVGSALSKLQNFLEALGTPLACVDEIRFFPNSWDGLKNPPSAGVTFEFRGNTSVTFYFVPRTAAEGALQGFLRIDRIVHRVGHGGTSEEILHDFTYLHHHCGCLYCEGPEYPYLPKDVEREWFERSLTAERRLHEIRKYVGRANY